MFLYFLSDFNSFVGTMDKNMLFSEKYYYCVDLVVTCVHALYKFIHLFYITVTRTLNNYDLLRKAYLHETQLENCLY